MNPNALPELPVTQPPAAATMATPAIPVASIAPETATYYAGKKAAPKFDAVALLVLGALVVILLPVIAFFLLTRDNSQNYVSSAVNQPQQMSFASSEIIDETLIPPSSFALPNLESGWRFSYSPECNIAVPLPSPEVQILAKLRTRLLMRFRMFDKPINPENANPFKQQVTVSLVAGDGQLSNEEFVPGKVSISCGDNPKDLTTAQLANEYQRYLSSLPQSSSDAGTSPSEIIIKETVDISTQTFLKIGYKFDGNKESENFNYLFASKGHVYLISIDSDSDNPLVDEYLTKILKNVVFSYF